MLGVMTADKIRIGLLYQHCDVEIVKHLRAELTSRCPDAEISADVVVNDYEGCYSIPFHLFESGSKAHRTQNINEQ